MMLFVFVFVWLRLFRSGRCVRWKSRRSPFVLRVGGRRLRFWLTPLLLRVRLRLIRVVVRLIGLIRCRWE